MDFSRIVILRARDSSRSRGFSQKYEPDIRAFANKIGAEIAELFLDEIPFEQTTKTLVANFRAGDLVLAVGGDGTARAAINSAMHAPDDVREKLTLAFISLGNSNDFSRKINGRVKDFPEILAEHVIDFAPLEITAHAYKNSRKFYTGSYATLGITTVAVEYLNQPHLRARRKKIAHLSPIASMGLRDLPELQRNIEQLEIDDFLRDGHFYTDDSIGFFLVGAAHGLLPIRGFSRKKLLANQEFFFHSANVRARLLGHTLFGKGVRGAGWTTLGLPGEISRHEKLDFAAPADLALQIGGDNIELKKIHEITAARAEKTVRIFAK